MPPPPYDFLTNVFFSLADFVVTLQDIIHITCKICVNQQLMLSLRLQVDSRLLLVKFGGESEVVCGFAAVRQPGMGGLGPLTLRLFKGQAYYENVSTTK